LGGFALYDVDEEALPVETQVHGTNEIHTAMAV